MKVNSIIKIDDTKLKQLSENAVKALEMTAEALHTEVVQAQVMPRDTGALQNEKTFVDDSKSQSGKASIVSEGPYARRLYYHPEYNFHRKPWEERVLNGVTKKGKKKYRIVKHEGNVNAQGEWFKPWLPGGEHEDFCAKMFKRHYKRLGGL